MTDAAKPDDKERAERFTWSPGDIEWEDDTPTKGEPGKPGTVKPVGTKFQGISKSGVSLVFNSLQAAMRQAGSD